MTDPLQKESDSVLAVVEEAPPKVKPSRKPREQTNTKPKKEPNYHVIIWNDEEHTYDYVIELLMRLFSHDFETAFRLASEVDHTGRCVAVTCHKELAELKRDQVLAYGADWRMPKVSKTSIRATIEPAPE